MLKLSTNSWKSKKKKLQKKKKTSDHIEETYQILKDVATTLDHRGKEILHELEGLDNKINTRHIIDNPYTNSSLRSLRSAFESFLVANKKKMDTVEKQIAAKGETGISKEEYAEYADSFKHFDKDNDGKLNALDFFGVLSLVGENPTEDGAKKLLSEIDGDKDGYINFDEFKNYIVGKRSDTDTYESYLAAFQLITQNKDYVTEEDLRRAGMTPQKIHYLITNMPRYDNANVAGYDYKLWLNRTHGRH